MGVGVLYVMVAKIRKVGCAMVCVGMDGCWFSLSRMDEACVLRTSGVEDRRRTRRFSFSVGWSDPERTRAENEVVCVDAPSERGCGGRRERGVHDRGRWEARV